MLTVKKTIICEVVEPVTEPFWEEHEWYVSQNPEAWKKMGEKRPERPRCPWCQRFYCSAICQELKPRAKLLFGKYKGHDIRDVPAYYLSMCIDKELGDQEVIAAELERREREANHSRDEPSHITMRI